MNDSISPPQFKLISFSGKIHLISNDREIHSVLSNLSSAKILGFDTETKPSFKKGEVFKVALLQLSTETDAYLIRLANVTQYQMIKNIFENEEIIKVGLAIRQDLKQLRQIFSFEHKNFVDLQDLAKAKGLKNFGLKGMTEEVLNATISKGPKLTNWEDPILSEQQLKYAATDAWIGLSLYQKILFNISPSQST